MTDDVLDLDAQPSGSPRRGPGWSRRRTAVVALVVILALGVGSAAVLWPKPAPEPEVLGLVDGPVEVWSTGERIYDNRAVAGDRLLVNAVAGPGRFMVRMLDAADGAELWRWESTGTRVPRLAVSDLPGTEWVGIVLGGEVVFLDRDTGEEAQRMRLPATVLEPMIGHEGEASVHAWVASSEAGTIFVGMSPTRTIYDDGGQAAVIFGTELELLAFHPGDLDTLLWRTVLEVGEV